ncbi:hypothetical protein DFQ11_102594 [Winogradskyella epiphytica]|uniref:Uncharacterized protein n=1 Tax=Winogradskyella epiphytica TaxID=262005 RepID=A0A2V4XGP0_9FLAO|nr:hypothetical protein [Winogradskyella epiphytica]PYE82014.1 hypothetical protein DFQ11_102594 [Winogradskyella epiphytica]GGW61102.1 hypothetical protein GCM10008085_10800 [Winogradskyella epiphytica]
MADTYKPGLGDFMETLQYHHSKLWFAGKNENWKLADFEIHELMETVEDIETFHAGRKDIEMINMIKPALDSVNNAIAQQNTDVFESSFSFLTNTCNQCHQATGYEFNRVKTPETSPFSNQDFRPIE